MLLRMRLWFRSAFSSDFLRVFGILYAVAAAAAVVGFGVALLPRKAISAAEKLGKFCRYFYIAPEAQRSIVSGSIFDHNRYALDSTDMSTLLSTEKQTRCSKTRRRKKNGDILGVRHPTSASRSRCKDIRVFLFLSFPVVAISGCCRFVSI